MNEETLLRRLIEELILLFQETADFHQRPAPQIAEILQQAILTLLGVHRRLQGAHGRYVVALVGGANVGKSNLLNALLGDLAPQRNGPCTATPIEFEYGLSRRVTAYHRQPIERPCWPCADDDAVRERLTALADDRGDEASQRFRKILVELPLPHPLLQGQLVIADTPGFGAAQLGAADGSHDQSLSSYLVEERIGQAFWIVSADPFPAKREIVFFRETLAAWCDDIVVTGSENESAEEMQRYERWLKDQTEAHFKQMHFVSGREGARARAAGDEVRLEAAGIKDLEDRIRQLEQPQGRFRALKRRTLDLSRGVGLWLSEQSDPHGRPLRQRWRPDSWRRWIASCPVSPFQQRLVELLQGDVA